MAQLGVRHLERMASRFGKAKMVLCASMTLARRALTAAKQLGDRNAIARACNSHGILARKRSELTNAEEWYLKGMSELGSEQFNPELYFSLLNNLGIVLNMQGRRTEALDCLTLSLAHDEEHGILEGVAESQNNIGEVFLDQERYSEAIDRFERSIAVKEQIGDFFGLSQTYHNLGRAHFRLGKLQAAVDWLVRSIDVKETVTHDELGSAETKLLLAEVYLSASNFQKASNVLEGSYDTVRLSRNAALVGKCEKLMDQVMRLRRGAAKHRPPPQREALRYPTVRRFGVWRASAAPAK